MRKEVTPEAEREKPVRQQNKFQLRFIPVIFFNSADFRLTDAGLLSDLGIMIYTQNLFT